MRRRLAVIAGIAALAGAAIPAAASAADTANEYTWTEAYIPTADPTVELHADVLKPKNLPAGTKTPVIMIAGPYLNHAGMTIADPYDPTRADGPQAYYTELNTIGRPWAKGYTVVLVDLRGFGGSSGCNDFGGPGEQADVKTAVEWAAAETWSNGKVGLFGKSYDGWTVVMGLATKPVGLAAAVPLAPIIDGYRALYMNGVHYGPGWWATPAVYQAQDAMPGTINDTPEYWQHIALGTNPACHVSQIALQNGLQDKDDPLGFWAARDLVARARTSTVPTLWEHGFLDINAKPDNFLDVMSGQQGPVRGWFGQWPHDRPNKELLGRDGFYLETMRFFDRHLKGDTTVPADPNIRVQDNIGRWRTEQTWPPADAARFTMPIKGGTFSDEPNNSAENGSLVGTPNHGTWSISQRLPHQVHLSGVVKVSPDVTTVAPRTNVVALLYDIAADGKATLITRGAFAYKASGKQTFELFPQDWRLLSDHRIGLLISGSDESLWYPPHSMTTGTVTGGSVSIPALSGLRTFESTSIGKPSTAMKARPAPFTVPAATITSAAVEAALPPAQQ